MIWLIVNLKILLEEQTEIKFYKDKAIQNMMDMKED